MNLSVGREAVKEDVKRTTNKSAEVEQQCMHARDGFTSHTGGTITVALSLESRLLMKIKPQFTKKYCIFN